MENKKIIYVLVLVLLTLTACTQVSITTQKTDVPSVVRPTDRDVITQPEVNQTELVVKAQPEVKQTELEVTTQPEVKQTALEVTTEPEATPNLEAICLRNSNETRLLINSVYGYCLQYPAEYDVVFENPTMVILFKISTLNATDPNFNIDIQPANGMTVEQAAEKVVGLYTVPGLEVQQKEIIMDGVKAIVLDGLTGQDPNRRVVIVHKDILYTLYFALMDRNQPEVYAQAEDLYNTVIQSFNFRPESNLCGDCAP
jgi:hypothetical protein